MSLEARVLGVWGGGGGQQDKTGPDSGGLGMSSFCILQHWGHGSFPMASGVIFLTSKVTFSVCPLPTYLPTYPTTPKHLEL